MADILKRKYAPISEEAWQAIDRMAKRTIGVNLCARKLMDINGPHGWQYSGVDLGRLRISDEPAVYDVHWGTREIMPLIEIRLPFVLSRMELDSIDRGCQDPELTPTQRAAENVARFEDHVVFVGFAPGQIKGVAESASPDRIALPKDPAEYPEVISTGLKRMATLGVEGPYHLVLGPDEYFALMANSKGFPTHKLICEMIGGTIHLCFALIGGFLLSARGGDFELTLGHDYAVGYKSHNQDEIEFFLTESFAFRMLDPTAAVPLSKPT